ncbi:MAG TPA: hypothetical protein VKB03_06990 [Conexibacter sp.]|nr:hypothetical protein [Conexibacter sp.]
MEAAFGIVGEPPSQEPGGRGASPRRWIASLGVFVGAAGFAAGLTCTYLAMRDLMINSGGSCASGGPYAVAAGHECGSEAGLLIAGIFGLLIFGGVFAAATSAGGAPGSGMDAGFLMWAALFGALGFNFLQLGFNPPENVSGAGGWIVAGVIFELMALGGVVPLVWSAREWRARGGAPEAPLFRGPQVRAKVNEGLVYEGVPGIAYSARRAEPGEVAAPPPPTDESQASSQLPKRLNIPRREWRAP